MESIFTVVIKYDDKAREYMDIYEDQAFVVDRSCGDERIIAFRAIAMPINKPFCIPLN
jgi:hypothetical protein